MPRQNTAWDRAEDMRHHHNRVEGPIDPSTTGTKDAVPADAFNSLPASATARLQELASLLRDAKTLSQASIDEQQEAQQRFEDADARFKSLTNPAVAARTGNPNVFS
jgi:hypothetical protein